jgi:hypothetical protein
MGSVDHEMGLRTEILVLSVLPRLLNKSAHPPLAYGRASQPALNRAARWGPDFAEQRNSAAPHPRHGDDDAAAFFKPPRRG